MNEKTFVTKKTLKMFGALDKVRHSATSANWRFDIGWFNGWIYKSVAHSIKSTIM